MNCTRPEQVLGICSPMALAASPRPPCVIWQSCASISAYSHVLNHSAHDKSQPRSDFPGLHDDCHAIYATRQRFKFSALKFKSWNEGKVPTDETGRMSSYATSSPLNPP